MRLQTQLLSNNFYEEFGMRVNCEVKESFTGLFEIFETKKKAIDGFKHHSLSGFIFVSN